MDADQRARRRLKRILEYSHLQGAFFDYDTGTHKIEKSSPTESPLLFEFDPKPVEERLTSWGGIPLVVQAFRSLGLPGSVQQHVVVKERQGGYDEATFVESFVLLNAAGGECFECLTHFDAKEYAA